MKRRSLKYQALFRFVVVIAIILLLNFIGNQYYTRIDLTKEKRFSLTTATKQLLNGLDDVVYVKVYLDGDFPAGFKRLQNSAQETLEEFKEYSGDNVEYVFINPSEGSTEERNAVYKELTGKGLMPTNLTVKGDEATSQKIIFPGAIFTYQGRELPVHLLENQIGFGPQQVLNNSVELLEYKFANSIKKLTQTDRPRILFTRGQGELPDENIGDIVQTLQGLQYSVDTINLVNTLIPATADVLVVAKPTRAFGEQEKFKLDQFIMRGGSVLWLIDAMNAEMDSLQGKPVYFSQPYTLNLEDQLFKYGVRLNYDLVQDLQCNQIPLVVGMLGDRPQTELFPWYYYPLVVSNNEHAIIRNLDAVAYRFAGTLDFVGRDSAKVSKIPLLHSSQYSKALLSPVRLHFSMLKEPPDQNTFQQKHLMLGALLEGRFESVFRNRMASSFLQTLDSLGQPFREESVFSKMIVVSDGDVIKNDVSKSGSMYPLGFYPYTEQTFANKDFILNCIEYLVDDIRLIETRNKEVRLRMLDTTKVKAEAAKWQIINVAAPLFVVAIAGLIYTLIRKRRYTK